MCHPQKPERNEYFGPNGYSIDPKGNIRRLRDEDGEQVTVLRATGRGSDAEWDRFYKGIVTCLDASNATKV